MTASTSPGPLDIEIPPVPEADPTVAWGVTHALLGIPYLVVAVLLLERLADVLGSTGTGIDRFAGLLAFQLLIVAWPIGISRSRGHGARRDFGLRFTGITDVVGAVASGLGLLLVGSVVVGFATLFLDPGQVADSSNTHLVSDTAGSPWLLPTILLAVVGAPVSEELFFRGLLLGALKRRFGSTIAVIGSTVAFTLPHYQGAGTAASLLTFSIIGAIGICLGLVVVLTGRVAPAIIAHATFNALVVAANL